MVINRPLSEKSRSGTILTLFFCLMMIFSLLSLSPPKAHAATDRWVAPPSSGGSDSNSGTQASPYATIGKAASVAQPGDTIKVRAGNYTGNYLGGTGGILTSADGTSSARIKYISIEGPGQARIVPPTSPPTNQNYYWMNMGDYVDIEGFEFDGTLSGGGYSSVKDGLINQGSYVTIKGNEIHHIIYGSGQPCNGAGGSAINIHDYNVAGFQQGTVVTGNYVHDIGYDPNCNKIQSIYISTKATVTNNVVYNNPGGAGIHLWHDAHNVIIANNTVVSHKAGIVVGATPPPNNYEDCTLESWGCKADNVNVFNNILYGNTYGVDEEGSLGTNNTYTYNLLYNNTTNWNLNNGSPGAGNVTGANANPQFVDYANRNLKLQSNSAAIDAGTSSNAPSVDIEGKSRIGAGAGYDIGAYEYGSSGSSKTLTFWEKDSEAGSTSGYWFKQALVDGTVVWESDVTADGTAWASHSVTINPANPSFNLQFRLISKVGVTNYPISYYVDDVAVGGVTITNADMEATTGWTYAESNANFAGVYDNAIFHGGAKSYKMSYPGATVSSAGYNSTITQSMTTNRTLTFWEKDSEAGSTSGYWFKQALVDGVVVWESDVTTDATSWASHSITISPASPSFNLQFRLISKVGVTNYPISYYVDDVAVGGVTITNATMEFTTGWTYAESNANFTGAYDTAIFHGGAKSYKMSYPGSTVSSAGYNSTISQSLAN